MSHSKFKVIFIAFLTIGLVLPTYFSFVSSSTGNIKINTTGSSLVGQQVQAGSNVNLYFGEVMWSGAQFYLFLSADGSTQLTSGVVYTPTFSVYDVADTTKTVNYRGENGAWLVGSNWINGSIPSTTALGNYYIKAVDQIGSSTAVTDTYLTVNPIDYNASLTISPPSGPGGIPITFSGSNYPVGSNVVISYLDPAFGTWNYLTTAIANASGKISADSTVPDLLKSLGTADYPETYSTISYRATVGTQVLSNANYDEYQRGLKTVGNSTAYGLFGNGTNLVSLVRVMPGDTIAVSGKWFNPGPIYIRWDGVNVVGTVSSDEWLNANIICTTATNATGYFSTNVTIPTANAGEHYLAVEDSQTRVIVKIFVSTASLQLSRNSGPGGASVQFTGSGYAPSSPVDLYYLDPSFSTWNYWTTTYSDSVGKISLSTEMPDMKLYSYSGDSNYSSTLSFQTQINGIAYSYVDYIEFARGIQQVGNKVAYGLFGNGTDLSTNVSVKPGDSLYIFGKWFHPGVVYIKFDGVAVVGTVTGQEWQNAQIIGSTTASEAGSCQCYVTIPQASGGVHFINIEDSQAKVILEINVNSSYIAPTPSPIPTPTSNPISNPTPTSTPNPSLPTPTIDLACKSTSSVGVPTVEITGSLLLGGIPVTDSPVQISYSVTGGSSWQSLTMVNTASDGSFAAVWQPEVTGNYLIKAASAATQTMNGEDKTINLALTPDNAHNVFTLTSNSTITQFLFNPDNNQLSFTASGPSGTKGYVNLYIPKTLINDINQLQAYIDSNPITFTTESKGDSWLISFSYSHSTHQISIMLASDSTIPEYPTIYLTIAIMAIAATAMLFLKKKTVKKSGFLNLPTAN
jgi:hypothetical protein